MNKRKFFILMGLVLVIAALAWGVEPGWAQTGPNPGVDYTKPNYANSPILRKFVDKLPGVTAAGANGLGQYIPVATADTTSFPGSDYYEIALVEYREQMHSDLPPVVGASKTDPAATGGTKLRGYVQEVNGVPVDQPHYLGPLILATAGRPVRIKFTNRLPLTASGGDLFVPVDTTIMGAGMGPDGVNSYTQNRATIHLHGGFPPWISDGTAHQWITPAGEVTPFSKGASQQNVPDMPVPPNGSATFYWPNQQSGRLMFYHDHAYGLTGPNVYAGEAAGYLLSDAPGTGEWTLSIPGLLTDLAHLVPLVIQDKSFVNDATTPAPAGFTGTPTSPTATVDPLWTWGPGGSLWFPHVYMPNQWPDNPDNSGSNPMGRWDYGPWFWPIFPAPNLVPAVSHVPEIFMDTPVVNGTPYPYLDVQPQAYRFRILNAANDRFWNLSLFLADPAISVGTAGLTEVKMVPFNGNQNLITPFPAWWYAQGSPFSLDDRAGGVPDPTTRGPAMIQIGTEGGLLPQPAVILNQPINYDYDRRSVTVLNVLEHALFLGPAERADVIIDFSKFAGKTLILYNDSPAPVPASDPRNDYYTGNADQTENGGAPSTSPGFGPNTRTIMQIRVAAGLDSSAPPDDYNPATLAALQTSLPAAYAATQGRPVVAESAYNPAFGTAWIDTYAHIFTGSAREPMFNFTNGTGVSVSMVPKSKAIQELFDPYGRMNATLGVELPFTSALNQTTIPLGFIDPTTDTLIAGRPQIWKITHNGVDTHAIHFHLVNVQVINRVGWDGMIKPPDPNELGWKDTVRMNPLEDIYVAMRGNFPTNLPFAVPSSVRTLDVTSPVGSTAGFTGVDPLTGVPMPVTNKLTNFGWEYTWHCHLLGHEENDMMRVLVLRKPASVDFDEDGISDVALYNTSTGVWSIKSSVGSLYNVTYGGAAYEPVPGDYDGDGKNDVVVYHSASGLWFIQPSTGSASYSVGYGGPAYTPVPGDYDGDGRTDIAVYHSASGLWFIKPSSGAADYFVAYGSAAYTPVPGDYDGDGKTDIAVYHPASGLWFIKPSSGAADYSVAYGSPAYTPIPGDYDGDGKTDVAVYHSASGLWFIKPSSGAADYYVGYGSPAYFPVPGDYDGDGKTDISVYHPASGLWFVRSSSGLPDYYVSYGGAGDIPVNLNYLLRYVY